MEERCFKFRIRGVNQYVEGVINGMMHCICRDNPAERFGYAVAEVVEIDDANRPKQTVSATMAVDTTQERFDKFVDCVKQKYGNLSGFELEVIE